jgi:hypothetical protein
MFSKLFALAAVATAVVAAPAPWDGGSGGSTTATPQCCQSVENSSDPVTAALVKSLIGVDVSGLNIPIGTGCSAIAVAGGVEWYASLAGAPGTGADSHTATRTRSLAAPSTRVTQPSLREAKTQCLYVPAGALIGLDCVPIIANA